MSTTTTPTHKHSDHPWHRRQLRDRRKPKPKRTATALRAGVASGLFGAVATTGTMEAHAANVSHTPAHETTVEMPRIDSWIADITAESVDVTMSAVVMWEQQAHEDRARTDAAKDAKNAKQRAVRAAEKAATAEAEKKRAAQEKKKAQERHRAEAKRKSASLAAFGKSSTVTPAAAEAGGSLTADIVSFVRSKKGSAYVLGATGRGAYDCSGLVQAAYRSIGVSLPRVAADQSRQGVQVSLGSLKPGDILYWGKAGKAYHVAVYVGGGKFVGAQNPRTGVVEQNMNYSRPTGAVRVL